MWQAVRIAGLMPAMLLLVSGCATKGWVQDLMGKRVVEVDQRFAKVEGRMGEEAQRVEGMGFRVQTLEGSVGEVRGVAFGARERADGAFARADEVNSRLTRLWSNRHARTLVDTLEVQFGFDRWDLDDGAQTALVSLVKELKESPKLGVELEGYTDPAGPAEYNVQLSQRRAEAVRRFLVEKGVDLPRIHSVGLGPLLERGMAEDKKRRVTVKLTAPAE
jgi:OOP family OmpA-OmpF porin